MSEYEPLLPANYTPATGPRPIDQNCPCGAGPGWRCRDQRARQQGTATRQIYRPHSARRRIPTEETAP